ncbi:uncharacterized protein LOC124184968 [Neodiprion fabricii]|uniref:uncharacterized protein LOC124184968 n=1 Tax=Neodiprion fabricii TaxID=2872261 RepID=UPI001ED95AFF|nr:uncharacterized protein LOC124184968 [Neodiprion fabricii]
MSEIVISECTSTTKSPNELTPIANSSVRDRWWSPAIRKVTQKSYICDLYVKMRKRLNKVNRVSRSFLPPAKIQIEVDDDPGGVITESYVKKFSLIKSIFDVRDNDNLEDKPNVHEINAWAVRLDAEAAHSTLLDTTEDVKNAQHQESETTMKYAF